ncbi:MAG TPA: hypothetical protein VLG28_11010 [Acidimicrobiia bacterium]|nr:hypothetical protein [Acidimicrobiia bacterium]
MTLWRLELLRLTRSRRLLALMVVYVFFGATGPFLARYLGEIVEQFGTDVVVQFPTPVPADGIAQYTSNANQIGLLVAVIVAAGGLVIDAIPEMSVFLRTRVDAVSDLLTPRLVMSFSAIAAAFLAGLAFAWYETAILLGGLSIDGMLAGAAFALVYLAFVVALVAAIGSRSGSVLTTVAVSIVVLLVLPVLGIAEALGRWLPSHLLGALDTMLRTSESATEYLPATVVTVALTAVLIWLATRWAATQEL